MCLKGVVTLSCNRFIHDKKGGWGTPVPMHMGGTKSKAVVKEGGINNGPAFCPLQKITQVAQMSVTTPNPVPGTVLIQDKHLAWAEPSLHKHRGASCHHVSAKSLAQCRTPIWTALTKQQKVSLSLWSNVSRCTISKSEAWSKLQGLAEINSSMPCFWALSASSGPTAQGKEHGSEERTGSVRYSSTAGLHHNTKTTGDVFVFYFKGDNKHLQLTLSTCIVSDSIKRFDVWACHNPLLFIHAWIFTLSQSLMFCRRIFVFFLDYPKTSWGKKKNAKLVGN